ncbi:hypothetical protein [Chelativorans sp. Marseille-P2723]|uniref:hypothetical protein n=1 Tax=Chelativorans sp. Marseille-P2723 TaxID=2709133 RepID=UPI00156DC0CC|nr:hypothetical protein [Chelativorans sp. Marseille-P2723]
MNSRTRSSSTQKPENFASTAAGAPFTAASEMGSDVKTEALQQAGQVQKTTSESMRAFAEAIRNASNDLSEKDQGAAAQLLAQAAGGLEQISNAVGRKKLDEIVDDVRMFGRQHPGAFMLGSALVGFALGRFAQTTVADARQPDGTEMSTAAASVAQEQESGGSYEH